jgi:general secretion pathway protein C
LRGFRIFPTGNPRLFEEAGLNSGDLVVAINGVSLENQNFKAGREMFNSVRTSSRVTVTVDRGGVRHDFTVNSPSQGDPADSAEEPDVADADQEGSG